MRDRSTTKTDRRQSKRNKSKNGMKVGSKSVFTIQQEQIKRSNKIKKENPNA